MIYFISGGFPYSSISIWARFEIFWNDHFLLPSHQTDIFGDSAGILIIFTRDPSGIPVIKMGLSGWVIPVIRFPWGLQYVQHHTNGSALSRSPRGSVVWWLWTSHILSAEKMAEISETRMVGHLERWWCFLSYFQVASACWHPFWGPLHRLDVGGCNLVDQSFYVLLFNGFIWMWLKMGCSYSMDLVILVVPHFQTNQYDLCIHMYVCWCLWMFWLVGIFWLMTNVAFLSTAPGSWLLVFRWVENDL